MRLVGRCSEREWELTLAPRYLLQNMDWLDEELGGFDDDYLIFDCPGIFQNFMIGHIEILSRPEFYFDRTNRTVYTPPFPADSCTTPFEARYSDMCRVLARVPVHGRPI